MSTNSNTPSSTPSTTTMPVFDLVEDELGTHGAGLYTIGIDSTGYKLQKLSYDSDNDTYSPDGDPIEIATTDTSAGQAYLNGVTSDPLTTSAHGTYTPSTQPTQQEDDTGIPVHFLTVGIELMLDDYGLSLSNGFGTYAVDIETDEAGAVTGGMLAPVTYDSMAEEYNPMVHNMNISLSSTAANEIKNILNNMSPMGELKTTLWNKVGQIDGVDIFGDGATVALSNEFDIVYTPKQPVLDFSSLDSTSSPLITDIAQDAPTSGTYVWYSSGSETSTNYIKFQPVKLEHTDATTYVLDSSQSDIVVESGDLLGNYTFDQLMEKINTLHQIDGGRVGDLPGQPRNVLLIEGEGGNPIADIADLGSDSESWWVRDHNYEFQPFYSSSGSHDSSQSMYERFGLTEGDFASYVDFHVNGAGNTDELVGYFTGNDPFFNGLNTVVSSNGGTIAGVDETGTSVSGTAGTDVYLIDDYHVSASAGSDIFIMGMGSSGQNSYAITQNLMYDDVTGAENLAASDPSADMDVLYVSWLPDGVTVDSNWGSVSHGSGGTGSQVYTDYFVGIEVFSLTDNDDYFAGGGAVDINWIDPGSGDDIVFGVDSVFTVLDYSSSPSDGAAVGVDIDNSGVISTKVADHIAEDNRIDGIDGAVIHDNGHIDVYTNVDYFVGTAADDTFIGGSGSDQFNAMWSDVDGDTFDGGAGDDTLIIEDSITNRGIFGDVYDAAPGGAAGVNSIDLNSIEVIKTGSMTAGYVYNVTGTNEHLTDKNDIDIELTAVERIDIREYVENASPGADNAEVYVVDSYEFLEGGQGDLRDMYYVTSLGHSTFDIHDGETPTYQILSEDTLGYDANIYYSGHHTDFDRSKNVVDWTALGTAAAASAATNNNENWQGHESIFFAWYDPDAEGAAEAYEIAVKYDDNDEIWRIANKAFDTFSDITLSSQDASTLNAMSHAIEQNSSLAFGEGETLRVYLGAAYQDITNVINSDVNVGGWDFSQAFTTSRSTYYIEIPNGTEATTQQVKVVYNSGTSAWELRADEEILVNIPAFRVAIEDNADTLDVDESASVVAGSAAAELISAGDGADTMLGGGGADTYAIGNGDADSGLAADAFGVVGDIINEVGGDIASSLGDSVNFTNIESIDNIFFDRSQIRFEKAESTLSITSNNIDAETQALTKDVVHIFDHFNADLPFRQVEQLLLDEGWGLDQIWNLVADGQGGSNRDILVGGSDNDTLVSGGGVDVMKGGAGADTFKLGSSDVTVDKIGEAHGDVTMIRDFVSGEDFIDVSALGITDATDVTVQTDNGKTYVVNASHVLAELVMDSDTTVTNEDLILL